MFIIQCLLLCMLESLNQEISFLDQKTKNDPLEEYLKTMFKEMEVIWANE